MNKRVADAARKAIERTYIGRMIIDEEEDYIDEGETLSRWKSVYEGTCFLDRSQVNAASNDGIRSNLKQQLRLLCAPEIEIKSGSRIKVEQNGMTIEFKYSGRPYIYPTHQELFMEDSDAA